MTRRNNARQVRDFANGHDFLEKTDKIDAAMIRKFGEDIVRNNETWRVADLSLSK